MPAIKHWQILPVGVHHIIIIDAKATMYIDPFNQLIIHYRYLISCVFTTVRKSIGSVRKRYSAIYALSIKSTTLT